MWIWQSGLRGASAGLYPALHLRMAGRELGARGDDGVRLGGVALVGLGRRAGWANGAKRRAALVRLGWSGWL